MRCTGKCKLHSPTIWIYYDPYVHIWCKVLTLKLILCANHLKDA